MTCEVSPFDYGSNRYVGDRGLVAAIPLLPDPECLLHLLHDILLQY